jgi:autotransporter-associated beta strand protein
MPLKKGPWLVCGKTGRLLELNHQCRWARWLFPILGLAALIWYLIRVIPKPSRADYPCQRVAAPIAFGGIFYFLSFFGLVSAYHHFKKFVRQNRFVVASICLVLASVCAAIVIRQNESSAQAAATVTANAPIGVARGINPGRVVWSYDPAACLWSGNKDGTHWWDSNMVVQARVDAMLSSALHSLTSTTNDADAWDALFRSFNQRRGNGNISYAQSPRQAIAIKINQNPCNYDNTNYYALNGVENPGKSGDEYSITGNPHLILALVKQLVAVNVAQTNIIVCDPTGLNRGWGGARTIGDNIYNYIHPLYPNVRFVDGVGLQGRELALWPSTNNIAYAINASGETTSRGLMICKQILDAGFLINMAIMKNHGSSDGPTLCGKNNYGSISGQRHGPTWGDSTPAYYSNLIELMGHQQLGEKTLLFMVDALYGAPNPNVMPVKWKTAPFNTNWPSSVFLSQDGVAIDSVGFDFMNAEWGMTQNSDYYLQEAAYVPGTNGVKLSGIAYQPTIGSSAYVGSLGVEEHWNNATGKKYSRNLGSTNGIELVEILPGVPSVSIAGLASGDSFSQGTNLLVQAVVVNNTNPISQVAFYQGAASLGTSTTAPYGITWSNVPAGNYILTAVATDSTGLSVTSNPVNISVVSTTPYVTITNPASGSSFPQGASIPVQAAVFNDASTISQIVFYQGTTPLGTSTTSPYGVIWSSVPTGSYVLTAVATDSTGLSMTSSPVNITVTTAIAALTWDADPTTAGPQDGSGSWNLTSSNWWNGTTNVVWNNLALPITTTFGMNNAPAGTVTLNAAITVSNLTFNAAASGDYTIAGGGYALTLANIPVVSVAANCSPTISASVAGSGFSKTGAGTLILSGANTDSGTMTISGGTLALAGNNSGSTAAATVTSGTALRLANASGLVGALALNSGSTLQLRADINTVFAPASVTLDSAPAVNYFDVNSASGSVTGKTLTLSGALAYANSSDQTINVTGGNGCALGLGTISMTATSHNPYRMMNVNVVPGIGAVIASFKAGNYGNYINAAGGGNVIVIGNLANTSNGSAIVVVNGGTTATLQGQSVKSGAGDAYRYYVPNGTLVLDNNSALINNTTGAGLNSSQFILGAATNIYAGISGVSPPAGALVAANNSYNCAVFLGDSNFPNGGLTLAANVTNYVSDGDAGFVNSGTMTIGGQNISGINTFANPIILGWTANKGKSVTLTAATGGEVDFTGKILQNGTDVTAGVTAGDVAHGGIVKLTGANTYAGGTSVANGTLLVNNTTGSGTGSGTVTVNAGGTLGGSGIINGPVTVSSGGTLATGTAISTLTINNSLTVAGNVFIKINKSLSPSNDLVAVSGVLTNVGVGTVTLTNLGPAFAAGDSFQFFNKALPNGGALTFNPAAPGMGLRWINNLSVNGTVGIIAVATNSVRIGTCFDISNLTLSWPLDHIGWRLQAQTNPPGSGIGTNWADICGVAGTNQCLVPLDPANGSVFFRLVYP